MSMTGTIVNALAIVAGGAVGLLFQRGIPERVSKTVMIGLGLCVLYIGISGAFACRSILIVIVAMTLGAAAGALLNIDGAIHRLGTWVEAHVHRHEGGPSLAEGFVTASLLCCVGAMAVNGSLDAGIRGDNSILLTKSMIDLVFCAMLATTLGAGVMLAGAAVFVVEGALTLLAGAIAPLLSEAAVADLTCAGSLLVAAIGLNQTGATKIKVADYLPALLLCRSSAGWSACRSGSRSPRGFERYHLNIETPRRSRRGVFCIFRRWPARGCGRGPAARGRTATRAARRSAPTRPCRCRRPAAAARERKNARGGLFFPRGCVMILFPAGRKGVGTWVSGSTRRWVCSAA